VLIRSSKPVFSGSVDHRVNLLDIVKTRNYLALPEEERDIDKDDLNLMNLLIDLDHQLYSGNIRHGIWNQDYRVASGSLPNSVEGA
jgi:hypothetical protein